jgi:hypothetical protein
MVAGGDGIDEVELLRRGSTQAVLGHQVMAVSTAGTFLRAFTFGRRVPARRWAAGGGRGLHHL